MKLTNLVGQGLGHPGLKTGVGCSRHGLLGVGCVLLGGFPKRFPFQKGEAVRVSKEEGGSWRRDGEGRREEGCGRRVRGERKRKEERGDEGERREEGGWMGRKEQEGKSVNVPGNPRRGCHSSRKR